MEVRILNADEFDKIIPLIQDYKKSIHEEALKRNQIYALKEAIIDKRIVFYVVTTSENMVGMCSISTAFSTFRSEYMGIFEDFYITPKYRKKGLAKKLVNYVFDEMKVKNINSVWVGCADMDIEMYKHLGFDIELGNLLTWNRQ